MVKVSAKERMVNTQHGIMQKTESVMNCYDERDRRKEPDVLSSYAKVG